MKIAALVRCDNSGISNVTWEFTKHLKPSKVCIIINSANQNFPERYDGITSIKVTNSLSTEQYEWLTDDVDVLWTAETFYDWRIIDYCRKKNVKTVLTTMIEMTAEKLPKYPDVFHCPSKLDYEVFTEKFSNEKVFIPWPINTDVLPWKKRTKAKHFIHTASHGGMNGRKGTQLLLEAMQYVKSDIKLTVYAWKNEYKIPNDPRIEVQIKNFKNYWQVWREGDVLVYPQGANGICLPIVEAMSSGMAVITTDIYPFNEYMPKDLLFKPTSSFKKRMAPALLEVEDYKISPESIADKIDMIANKDISKYSEYGKKWAKEHSWKKLLPRYVDMFKSVLLLKQC